VPDNLDPGTATLFNALGTAYEWSVRRSGLGSGQSVLILGAGQRGLASVVSTRAAGAGLVIVSGTGQDELRLDRAATLGANRTVDVTREDLVSVVLDATDGRGVDVVVDTSAGAVEPVVQAVGCVTDGGTIVLGGLKHGQTAPLDIDQIVLRAIRIQGARSAGWPAYHRALEILADDPELGALRTHVFGLEEAAQAVGVLSGGHPDRIYVGIDAAG
jgi:threonine dehydrogenase-like Zn-dependent dehydrogenase